jgi:repressor LexA
MEPLTSRQERVLKCVTDLQGRHGRMPTYREIGAALRIASTQGVRRHLEALESKGYLSMSRSARGLRLAPEVEASLGIPLIGRISAGRPIEALENFEGRLDLGQEFGSHPECFALRVKGESMIGAGIEDGDVVIVQAGARVANGQIAAVAVDSEATVKRVELEPGLVRLVPANPAFRPLEIREGEREVRVLGRVVGIVRKLTGVRP